MKQVRELAKAWYRGLNQTELRTRSLNRSKPARPYICRLISFDLLPTRDSETVAAWLRQHPSVQVVSRDRAGAFADAIRKGAPNAAQVADRWHLLNNLLDTLIRSLERHRGPVREGRDRLGAPSGTQLIRSSDPERPQTLASQRTQGKRKRCLECRLSDYVAYF